MKTKLMAITLAVTTALSAGAAFADQNPNDHRGNMQQNQRDDHRGNMQQNQRNDHRSNMQQDHHQPRYQQNHQAYRHDMPRPGQEWRKGGRVPAKYRGTAYRVSDWRSHDLPAPPRGHRWVRVNGDYVLVAIATGVIAQILLGGH
ncbi:RcnB family protein [Acinetobacter sp. MB5]|uniref:RcnB family protein n=1 Tax=Acinetobacter sp. MB5 TaxID=2069438 RepID=UPI001D0D81B5|nr:RcnB family protein [Acinetobacter sp. MB5]